jgi:integral membrane protein (TIGR01906 family)
MSKIPPLLKLLISLLVPLLLVLGTVQVLVTDQYLEFEYGKAGFPADPYGFDREQRLAYASVNFRWVRQDQPIEALAGQRLGNQPLYNQRELKHMQDVQGVFWATRRIWLFALGLFALTMLFFANHKDNLLEFAAGLKIGGLIVAGLVAVVGLLAIITWQVWFVAFHQVFFTLGSWTFNTSDTLIRLFPERFWYDAALTISGLSIISGLATALIGWYMQQRNQSIPKAHIAQTPNPSEG